MANIRTLFYLSAFLMSSASVLFSPVHAMDEEINIPTRALDACRNERCRDEFERATDRARQLTKENEDLQSEAESLKADVKFYSELNTKKNGELNKIRESEKELLKQLSSMEEHSTLLEREYQGLIAERQDYISTVQARDTDLQKLNNLLEKERQGRAADARASEAKGAAKAREAAAELQRLRDQVEKERKRAEEALSSKSKTGATAGDKALEIAELKDLLEKERRDRAAEAEASEAKVAAILGAKDAEIAGLKEAAKTSAKEIRIARELYDARKTEITALTTKVAALEATIANTSAIADKKAKGKNRGKH